MVTESQAYFIKTVEIPSEINNIRFESFEIGKMSMMLERETDDKYIQLYQFFKSVAEQELENATERLTEYREKLVNFDKQQRLLQPV